MRVTVPARFCGPPGSANGGYVAGLLASRLGPGAVEVRLAAPPPVDTELDLDVSGDEAALRDGDTLLATARRAELDLEVPAPVSPDEARAAAASSPWDSAEHPFPTCFGCGPLREPGDALRHHCGPVPGRDVVACPMTTHPALPQAPDGTLATEVLWAALDCPSAAAVVPAGSPPHVLGTLVARVDGAIPAGEPHVCMAWSVGAEGRKRYAGSALLDADGRVRALGRAVWISLVRPPAGAPAGVAG